MRKTIFLFMILSFCIAFVSGSIAQEQKSNLSKERIEIAEKKELILLPGNCQFYTVSNNYTIAFVNQKEGGYGTKTINVIYNSGETKKIVNENCKIFHLKFSPDNRWLSYGIREINSVGRIILHNLNDDVIKIIENGDKECGNLDFSPDSKKFVYARYLENRKTRNIEIVISDFAGTATIITKNANHPKWSPTGDKIAISKVEPFSNSRSWTSFIWIYEINDDNEIKLINSQGISTGTISWSPDGTKISGKTNTKVGILDLANDSLVEVGEYGANNPLWISCGHKLIFEQPYYKQNSNGEILDSELFVVDDDGSGLMNLTNTPNILEENPIYFSNHEIIYSSRKDGKVELSKAKIEFNN